MAGLAVIGRGRLRFLGAMLLCYILARLCQLYADRLPALLIVVLHVVPPALFALAHGAALYRVKGMAVFTFFCLGIGTLAESLSLRWAFPFGHYYFTGLMGPQVFQLPVLLALAYLGIGYVAWILASLILGYTEKPLRGVPVFTLPVLAAFIMVAWDLAMDADWSTLDRAWIWQDGGSYFGVPLSNFFGWFVVAYLYYQAFALYRRANPIPPAPRHPAFWRLAILLYGVCALGNLLLIELPMAPPVVLDEAGHQWFTADILQACILVSLLIMFPLAVLAWSKVVE